MTKNINTLVDDIYKVLRNGVSFDDIPTTNKEHMREFCADLGELMYAALDSSKRKRDKGLRLSGVGRPVCQLWYDAHTEDEEELDGPTRFKFIYGDIIELLMVLLIKLSDHDVSNEQLGVIVEGVKGHIDLTIDDDVVDIKSASPYSYKKFQDGRIFTNDPFGYIPQISAYNKAVTNGEQQCHFLVVNKVTGELYLSTVEEIDQVNIVNYIKHVKEVTNRTIFSPRNRLKPETDGKSGNMKLGVTCTYCRHKEDCWSDSNDGRGLRTFDYSTGRRYLTTVVKEPKTKEIIRDV